MNETRKLRIGFQDGRVGPFASEGHFDLNFKGGSNA
jgi:hypothetical protein